MAGSRFDNYYLAVSEGQRVRLNSCSKKNKVCNIEKKQILTALQLFTLVLICTLLHEGSFDVQPIGSLSNDDGDVEDDA